MRLRTAQPYPPVPPARPSVPPGPAALEHPRSGHPDYVYGPNGQILYSWRNRWVAGILGVLLGPLGVHRFYLGYTGIGVLQLVVSFTGIGALWGIIDGILCLCGALRDVDGYPLRE
ncbi:MAG: TM2 domain-containing protein [Planctomycetes bacterium]|nr:TM2 domain-containing protein [Planctomycetota bacterium]